MHRRLFVSGPLVAALMSGCALPSGDEESLVNASTSPIIGGKVAGVCAWPTTVLVGNGCSGTLVHPRVVMTAKHCLTHTPASVRFGESRLQVTRTVNIAQCYRNPNSDFGFCTLTEDVTGFPIIPVMAPCEMSELKMGAPTVEAGFGDQSGARDQFGTKKSIEGMIVRASPTRTTVDATTGTQDGEYFGDSGGPLFLKMPDGTYRLVGNDWTSPNWNNSGKPRVSTYTSVPFHVAWAEMQSGIDITPCHDANGWKPGPDCKGSPTNPGEGVGTWANSCAGQTMVVSPTCGGDGGVPVADASTLPPTDGGAVDAGDGRPDAGQSEVTADARPDTQPSTPPVLSTDAAAADGNRPNPAPGATDHFDENGCGCRTAGPPSLGGIWLLLGLMLVKRTRRRQPM
jgi:MYXO-CTERM domain-containing protein